MTDNRETIEMLKMLKEQALKSHNDTAVLEVKIDSFNFVLDEAIKALEQQEKTGWIPVTERLPDEDGEYLVTKKLRYFGNTEIDMACWFKNLMTDGNNGFYKSEQVIAWMPLPKAYKEEKND